MKDITLVEKEEFYALYSGHNHWGTKGCIHPRQHTEGGNLYPCQKKIIR